MKGLRGCKGWMMVVVVLVMVGCGVSKKYVKVMDSWMGHDVNEMIRSWGPPSDVYEMPNGNKMYTWLDVGGTRIVTNYNRYLNMTTGGAVTYWCKRTMTVSRSGVVIDWLVEGNACR